MPNAVESILAVFLMSLGDVGFIWEGVAETNHEIIGKIHFFIFIAIVVILLLNLLIAMMGDTYAKIAEIKKQTRAERDELKRKLEAETSRRAVPVAPLLFRGATSAALAPQATR